ncbi:hypothetical protein D3C78_491740 [compost metagenome]
MVVDDDRRRVAVQVQFTVQVIKAQAQEGKNPPQGLFQRITTDGCVAHEPKAAAAQRVTIDCEELIVEHVRQGDPQP